MADLGGTELAVLVESGCGNGPPACGGLGASASSVLSWYGVNYLEPCLVGNLLRMRVMSGRWRGSERFIREALSGWE